MRDIIHFILYKIIPALNRLRKKDKAYERILIYYCSEFSAAGGLTDRLKGIVSAYRISLVSQRKFKIIFNKPFKLTKIFSEKEVHWDIVSESEQKKLLSLAAHYDFIDQTNLSVAEKEIQKTLKDRSKIIALRVNQDYSSIVSSYSDVDHKSWRRCFFSLFELNACSRDLYDHYLNAHDWNRIIGIHCRFVNLLGDKLESRKEISESAKTELITKITNLLKKMVSTHKGDKILLCSDSNIFLTSIRQNEILKNKYIIIEGTPRHSEKNRIGDKELQKIVADFFLLAECRKVYSIRCDGMYPSAFPEYAAKINNKHFETITE